MFDIEFEPLSCVLTCLCAKKCLSKNLLKIRYSEYVLGQRMDLSTVCSGHLLCYDIIAPHVRSSSVLVAAAHLFGTSVPNFGAPLGMVMAVAAWLPGLEEGEESMLPLD